jgi:hypothetical protein
MNRYLNFSAKNSRVGFLAGVSLSLLLSQPLPLLARTSSSGIDAEKSPDGTPFMSGGVSVEERQQLQKMAQGYDLKLAFADRQGDYLSDIKVTVDDAHGKQILSTTTAGPWLYVKLPQGKYDVKASFDDRSEEIKDVDVSQGRLTSKLLHWDPAAQQISQR